MTDGVWQYGSILLPSGVAPTLKRAVSAHIERLHAETRDEVIRLHDSLGKGTRSGDLYTKALSADVQSRASVPYEGTARAAALRVLGNMVRDGRASNRPTVPSL